MGSLSARISLFISATLLWLNLPVSRATQETLAQTDRRRVLAQTYIDPGVSTPIYQGDPPPPLNQPLPPERLRQDTQPLPGDFRVAALQPDFTGDLWIGSWLGLARINPNTGRLLARIGLPNYTIGALAQDRVGRI